MAINKNFVIKNGVQVSTDLIIGDADTNKVGIGTTVPHYDLHVGVARGSRGGIGVTDAVVAGVATINQLSVTGISTFAGALDVNSTVDFAADVVFNGTNDITYDQSESALVFNDNAAIRVGTSSDFSIMHDGSNTILRERGTGALKILSNSVELLGATAGETLAKFNENGNVELYHDNTKHFEVVAIGATVFGDFIVSGVTTSKELNVSSGSTFGGNVDVNANIDVSGNSVLNGDVDLGNATSDTITATGRFDSDLVPSTDGARDLGSSSLEWMDLHLDGTAKIDTLTVDENAGITGDLTVTGGTILNGNVDLGDATGDTITATGRFDSDLVPSSDGARDLGSGSLEWKDLYVDGVGYIDQIESDGGQIGNIQIGETGDNEIDTASLNLIIDSAGGTINIDDNLTVAGVSTFSGIGSFGTDMNVGITTFFVDKSTGRIGIGTNVPTAALEIGKTAGTGIGVSIFDNGNVAVSGILTVGGDLNVKGDITYDEITGRNLNITGITTLAGTSNFNGDVNLGNATSDTITPTGRFDGDIVPSTDGARDLGTTDLEFKDLFIDGTANIDSLVADTADINGGTVDAANIGASTPGTGAFTTLSATTSATVGTAATIQVGGQAAFAGIVTANGGLSVGSNGSAGVAVSAHTNGNFAVSGITTLGGALDVNSTSNFSNDVVFEGAGTNITFDASTDDIVFSDGAKAVFGTGLDLNIYHTSSNNYIQASSGSLFIRGSDLILEDADGNDYITCSDGGSGGTVVLKHLGNARVSTTADGADFGGTGSIRVPNGTTGERNGSPAAGDFRYNTTTGKFEGYTSEWGDIGGSGGVEETSTSVSSTSATSTGSFAIASFRSASIIAQITQGSNYQVGRYLVIHDGTTVTTIEESAVATGSMLGTFEGVINSSNLEFRVTMGSSSSATVKTKIDTVTV